MQHGAGSFAEIRGRRAHCVDSGGDGPAVVLLHGFPLSCATWAGQVEALAPRWRVVAPDLAGFGLSDPPGDPEGQSMADYADDVAALLAHLGLGPVVLGGLSMGGYVSLAVLRHHPSLARALILADTRPGPDTPEVAARRTSQQAQVRAGRVDDLLDTLVGPLLAGPEHISRVREVMASASPEGILAALEAMKARPDATPELAAISVPTLVVVGALDTMSPPAVAQDMVARLPRARLAVVPGAGHLSNVESPEAFDAALVAFLEEVAG